MSEVKFDSTNPIILSFVPYSGGKFISNCLALSRHACPQNKQVAEYLLANPGDYSFRLSKILTTLPKVKKMNQWQHYEWGDIDFYGNDFLNWTKLGKSVIPNDITVKLSKSDLRFFIVEHDGPETINRILKVWPNATILRLVNTRQFQDISVQLKSSYSNFLDKCGNYSKEKYTELAGAEWPPWERMEAVGYDVRKLPTVERQVVVEIQQFYPWHTVENNVVQFNIDGCIFNKEQFLTSIKQLYNILNFEDFDQNLIEKFYTAYIELHLNKK